MEELVRIPGIVGKARWRQAAGGSLVGLLLICALPTVVRALPVRGTIRIQPIYIEHWLDDGADAEARIRRDIQCAKQVFSQIGITVVDDPIVRENDPRFFKRLTDQPFNEDDFYTLLQTYAAGYEAPGVIPFFYVFKWVGRETLGQTVPPTMAKGMSLPPGIIVNRRTSSLDTLAHEIGHFLLNHWVFPGSGIHASDPRTLMADGTMRLTPSSLAQCAPTGNLSLIDFSVTESALDSTRISQVEAMYSSPYVHEIEREWVHSFQVISQAGWEDAGGQMTVADLYYGLWEGSGSLEWGNRNTININIEYLIPGAEQPTLSVLCATICPWGRRSTDFSANAGQENLHVLYDMRFGRSYDFGAHGIMWHGGPSVLSLHTVLDPEILAGAQFTGAPETAKLHVSSCDSLCDSMHVNWTSTGDPPHPPLPIPALANAVSCTLLVDNTDLQAARRVLWEFRTPIISPSVTGNFAGDYDGDGVFGLGDIAVLIASFGPDTAGFDMTNDRVLDRSDLETFVLCCIGTRMGDANLDGLVDELDLDALAARWQQPSGWDGGNFDGTGVVDEADLAVLLANWQGDPINWDDYPTLAAFAPDESTTSD